MLHATVEHQLDAPPTAEADVTRSQDEAARAAFIAWQTQTAALPDLDTDRAGDPDPPTTPVANHRSHRDDGRPGHDHWHQAVALGIALALGAGAGWIGHRAWSAHDKQVETTSLARGLMRDAMVAHAVYGVDARHPVELGIRDRDQLLSWLSRRLGRPVTPPDLGHIGWNLLGGRLLPGDIGGAGSTRAQLMYEDKAGQRLTLYLGVLDPSANADTRPTDTPSDTATPRDADQPGATSRPVVLAFASRDSTHSVYWTTGGFGMTLVGELPRDALERIGNEVYRKTAAVATTRRTP